jgi:hypothetical protein
MTAGRVGLSVQLLLEQALGAGMSLSLQDTLFPDWL